MSNQEKRLRCGICLFAIHLNNLEAFIETSYYLLISAVNYLFSHRHDGTENIRLVYQRLLLSREKIIVGEIRNLINSLDTVQPPTETRREYAFLSRHVEENLLRNPPSHTQFPSSPHFLQNSFAILLTCD
jgi:hypothetical protein